MAADGKVPAHGVVRRFADSPGVIFGTAPPELRKPDEGAAVRDAISGSLGLRAANPDIRDFRARVPLNLSRKGIWGLRDRKDAAGRSGRDMLGEFQTEGSGLTAFDLDLVTWLSSRWLSQGDERSTGVETTLYGMVRDFFGHDAATSAGGYWRRILDSIERMRSTKVWMVVRAPLTERVVEIGDVTLISSRWAVVPSLRLQREPNEVIFRRVAGQRGTTLRLTLEDWWLNELRQGHTTTISWRAVRSLDRLSKRLYYQLEGDRFRRSADGAHQLRWYALETPFLQQLGIAGTQHAHVRRLLGQALERICQVDPRYDGFAIHRAARRRWQLVVWRKMGQGS